MVTVGVKHFLEIPSDDSLTQPALEELSSTTNSPRQPALEELSSTTNSPRPLTQPALEELSSTTNSPRPLTQPALEELPGTTNRSEPDLEIQEGTTDNEQLLGAPDLTVQLVKDPHIYLVIGEVLSAHTHKPVCYICDCSRGNVYSTSQIREINVYRRPSE
jgi:hypothetical protein